MIKNLLYSIFLHSILLLVIYFNFNINKFEEIKSNEVAVSLISIDGYEDATLLKPNETPVVEVKKTVEENIKKEVKKVEEKAKSVKESKKNKIKKKLKEPQKTKIAKSVKQKAKKLHKKTKKKKEDKVQQDSNKNKKNKESEETSKKEQNAGLDKDLGTEKISKENIQEQQKNEAKKEDESIDMANSIENIDLSAREKFNIKTQLKLCYKRAIDETKLKSNEKILISIKINKEGYIQSNLSNITDNKKYNDPQETLYKVAIDNVKRALELCSPLRNLPVDKYEIWQEVVLEFSSEEVSEEIKE